MIASTKCALREAMNCPSCCVVEDDLHVGQVPLLAGLAPRTSTDRGCCQGAVDGHSSLLVDEMGGVDDGRARRRVSRDGVSRWTAYFWDDRGREQSAGTFSSCREADRAWRDAEAKVRDGRFVDIRAGHRCFERYVRDVWLPNHAIEATTRKGHTTPLRSTFSAEAVTVARTVAEVSRRATPMARGSTSSTTRRTSTTGASLFPLNSSTMRGLNTWPRATCCSPLPDGGNATPCRPRMRQPGSPTRVGRSYRHGTLTAYSAGRCQCPHGRSAYADYRAGRRAIGLDRPRAASAAVERHVSRY